MSSLETIVRLHDANEYVRFKAIEALGQMRPRVIAKYAPNIVTRLDDDDECVRKGTIEVLGKLKPQVLAKYAQHIISMLDDDFDDVRQKANHYSLNQTSDRNQKSKK